MENIVAIIPARGGSKRIPGKNVKLFCGKPIMAYSIEAALQSGLFARVIVSTDSKDIADVALQYGAEVPCMRPPELADDHAGTDEVILHMLEWLELHDKLPKWACCIYATAPFVTPGSLRRGFDILCHSGASTAISVTHFEFPIYRALRQRVDGKVEMIWPENLHRRSQDLPEAFHDAGQFYWLDVGRYCVSQSLFNDNTAPVLLSRHEVQDIDTPEDWLVAERMYAVMKQQDVDRVTEPVMVPQKEIS